MDTASEFTSDELKNDIEVWPENEDVIRLFFAAHPTMWRYIPMGGRIGLDYPSIEIVRQWYGIQEGPELAQKLKYCELIALNHWAIEQANAQPTTQVSNNWRR